MDIIRLVLTASVVLTMAATACGPDDDGDARPSAPDAAPVAPESSVPPASDGIVCVDASAVAPVIASRFSFEGARLVAAESVEVPANISPDHRYVVIAGAQPVEWDPAEPWGPADAPWPAYDPDDPRSILPMDGAKLVDGLEDDPAIDVVAMDGRAQELTSWTPAPVELAADVESWLAETRTLPDCLSD